MPRLDAGNSVSVAIPAGLYCGNSRLYLAITLYGTLTVLVSSAIVPGLVAPANILPLITAPV